MRLALAALSALFLCLGSPSTRAADLTGTWVIDQAQWSQELDRLVDHMLAKIPPKVAAQMKAKGMDPATEFREAAKEGLSDSIEFLPNGVVRTTRHDDAPSDDGHWTLEGDDIKIVVDDAEGLEAMVGKVEGDWITLKPILAGDAPGAAFMRDMTYPLVRRP
ncbi:MAG: hypothetical protein ACJ8H8_07270 [Geminicoccaceae bacterium]